MTSLQANEMQMCRTSGLDKKNCQNNLIVSTGLYQIYVDNVIQPFKQQ